MWTKSRACCKVRISHHLFKVVAKNRTNFATCSGTSVWDTPIKYSSKFASSLCGMPYVSGIDIGVVYWQNGSEDVSHQRIWYLIHERPVKSMVENQEFHDHIEDAKYFLFGLLTDFCLRLSKFHGITCMCVGVNQDGSSFIAIFAIFGIGVPFVSRGTHISKTMCKCRSCSEHRKFINYIVVLDFPNSDTNEAIFVSCCGTVWQC